MASIPGKCRTSSPCAAIRRTSSPVPAEPKGAANLLRRHGTLDAILTAGRFPQQTEQLRLYRWIATMNASAPLPSLADQLPTWAKASALARSWNLNQFADRLLKMTDVEQ